MNILWSCVLPHLWYIVCFVLCYSTCVVLFSWSYYDHVCFFICYWYIAFVFVFLKCLFSIFNFLVDFTIQFTNLHIAQTKQSLSTRLEGLSLKLTWLGSAACSCCRWAAWKSFVATSSKSRRWSAARGTWAGRTQPTCSSLKYVTISCWQKSFETNHDLRMIYC